jgi:hypothetical protein
MGLIDTFKSMFAEPPKRMAGAMVVLKPPAPHIQLCDQYKVAAEKLKLSGWVLMTDQHTLSSEVEGTFEGLQEFLKQLDLYQMTLGPVLETRWLDYRNQFTSLQIKFPSPPSAEAPTRK